MNENRTVKQNYNDPQYNHEFYSNQRNFENTYGEPSYLPTKFDYSQDYTDSFYDEEESTGVGSFLAGAVVGGVIGAAVALFLAPKTGSEMRGNLSVQASQLKDKSIEFGTVAKEKATEFTSVAKEKTGELTKTIQEQSGQLVDKVKSMKSKTTMPMDDGTVSYEDGESMEFIDTAMAKGNELVESAEENITATAEALKNAVVNAGAQSDSHKKETTGNSNVSYDNSDNFGKDKITNQNYVSDINEQK